MGQVLEGHEGNPIGADEENRMKTFSTILTEDHYAAMDADAYTMDIDGITPDSADYWLAVIKNTDDDPMVVTSVTLWVNEFSDIAIVEAFLGSTFTYTDNGTVVTPTNLKSGVTGGADGEFYVNDGSGNITTIVAGSVAGRFIFTTTPLKWEKGSGWVVPKNQTFMLQVGSSKKFTGYISFYYHRS